jgi:hypothetical protein
MVWMAFSRAFRTPTLLKSTDRQWGQRGESTPYSSAFRPILLGFLRFSGIAGQGRPRICVAAIRATYCPGHGNLFGGPYVRLRQSNILLGTGNLAPMPFRKSLVHTPSLSAIHRDYQLCPVPILSIYRRQPPRPVGLAGPAIGWPVMLKRTIGKLARGQRQGQAAGRNLPISPFRSFRSTRSIR